MSALQRHFTVGGLLRREPGPVTLVVSRGQVRRAGAARRPEQHARLSASCPWDRVASWRSVGARPFMAWCSSCWVSKPRPPRNDSMIGPVLLPLSPYRARAERLVRAAESACARIHPLTDDVFPSLGEALVWLVAIDDLLSMADSTYRARRDADPDGAGLPGLTVAMESSP